MDIDSKEEERKENICAPQWVSGGHPCSREVAGGYTKLEGKEPSYLLDMGGKRCECWVAAGADGPRRGSVLEPPLSAGGVLAHVQTGLGSGCSTISLALARATAVAVPGETQPATCSTDKLELTEAQAF